MTDIVRVTARLDAATVEKGYREGVFPMGDERGGVITWHRPKWRGVLPVEGFHASRSLRRTLQAGRYEVSFDRDFAGVVEGCAEGREVWISEELKRVYGELHRAGKAHSVEVWVEGRLAGGVYGVHLGGAFFAESKFHRVRDMSKVALAHLVGRLRQSGFLLMDVQYWTEHLAQFGVMEISGREYRLRLEEALGVERTF